MVDPFMLTASARLSLVRFSSPDASSRFRNGLLCPKQRAEPPRWQGVLKGFHLHFPQQGEQIACAVHVTDDDFWEEQVCTRHLEVGPRSADPFTPTLAS